ncbi:MAG TPA: HEPN domain-containing protein [Candidatus Sulfotelmatobacter sp.]|nr:HEPN domain-containing protein [Candidatus Sulfotelmatobacter sp.]
MPNKPEHIAKAESNQKLADTLSRGAYLDWAVTLLFYSALHYVDAILAVSGVNPETHTERGDAMGNNDTLKRIRPEYRTLETLSRNARYREMKIDPDDLQKARENFDPLCAHLRSRMGLK